MKLKFTLICITLLTAACAVAQNGTAKVYLDSASVGNRWNAVRNQTIELAKDVQKEQACSGIAVTTRKDKADYLLTLNHIEHGFARDNQILVSNTNGDVLLTREGGSIAKNVKFACMKIVEDWKQAPAPVAKQQ